MLNRNSSTKSLPALTSLPRFLLSLSVLFPPNFPHWQPEYKIFTYNLSTSDTNKHVYLKFCCMLKANIILLAKKLLNQQEVIQATEVYSKLREISLNYFLPTYCIENASTFKALCQLAALSPPSSRQANSMGKYCSIIQGCTRFSRTMLFLSHYLTSNPIYRESLLNSHIKNAQPIPNWSCPRNIYCL